MGIVLEATGAEAASFILVAGLRAATVASSGSPALFRLVRKRQLGQPPDLSQDWRRRPYRVRHSTLSLIFFLGRLVTTTGSDGTVPCEIHGDCGIVGSLRGVGHC